MGWGAVAHESGGVVHGYRYAVPGYVYTGVYAHGCICRMASESLFSVFSVEMKMKILYCRFLRILLDCCCVGTNSISIYYQS